MKADNAPIDTEDDMGSLESPGSPIDSAENAATKEITNAANIINPPFLALTLRPHE